MPETKRTCIPELGISVTELNTPEAAVSKYLAKKVGLNFRVDRKMIPSITENGIVNVRLALVIPQYCPACKQATAAKIIENAGMAKVRKDVDGDWQVDSVEFYDKQKEIEQS